MTSRFEVSPDAVREAGRILGLEHPVRVFICAYVWGDGRYYVSFKDEAHRVGVAADLSFRSASRVLWHELTHAVQVERLGSEEAFRALWWQQMHDLGLSRQEAARATGRRYRRAGLEVEARVNERRHRKLALAHRRAPVSGLRAQG